MINWVIGFLSFHKLTMVAQAESWNFGMGCTSIYLVNYIFQGFSYLFLSICARLCCCYAMDCDLLLNIIPLDLLHPHAFFFHNIFFSFLYHTSVFCIILVFCIMSNKNLCIIWSNQFVSYESLISFILFVSLQLRIKSIR